MNEPKEPVRSTAEVPHEVPRVALVTPFYGSVSMGLRPTLNMATQDRSLLSIPMEVAGSSSVLPHCFNQLFVEVLNARDAGRVTHMAMCHSDIIAEPGWLDVLWAEMWMHDADLISTVVPIKGPTGRTSTAIGREDDPWHVGRCINLRDRKQLPATFGPEHVCGPGEVLLINTGLFLCDLRHQYWDDFAFQFHTRIDRTKGFRVAECRSEDWEMSHMLNRAGARYMASFKPRLRHEGLNKWPNYEETAN